MTSRSPIKIDRRPASDSGRSSTNKTRGIIPSDTLAPVLPAMGLGLMSGNIATEALSMDRYILGHGLHGESDP
ncbi:hypothetical protein GCM10029978_040330 [Actinoallomurus acanthiterrae]